MGLADRNLDPEVSTEIEKKGDIKTDLDRIYDLVKDKKRAPLSQIADALNASIRKVEEWARVLDKQGLLELYYPVFGQPELRIMQKKQKKPKKDKNKKTRLLLFTVLAILVAAIAVFLTVRIIYKA